MDPNGTPRSGCGSTQESAPEHTHALFRVAASLERLDESRAPRGPEGEPALIKLDREGPEPDGSKIRRYGLRLSE